MHLPLSFGQLFKSKPTVFFYSAKGSDASQNIVNLLQDDHYQMKRIKAKHLRKRKVNVIFYDELADQGQLFELLTLCEFDIVILIGDMVLKYYDGTIRADRCITVERRGINGVGAARKAILATLGIKLSSNM